MKKNVFVSTAIALLFLLSISAGCKKDEPPSCSEALGHFYDQQCILRVGSDDLTRGEAITGCENDRPTYSACGCESQFNDGLECFNGIGMQQCYDCDGQINRLNTCMAACS